ncbi:Sec63-domain-containing protein [Neoconidiobolus thromboides FSU 785]|nr:Sec63-domain-containing protein [Neoconidiobolus thromboides FSU 785]
MASHYDESGVNFYYFLISVLAIILIPYTLSPLFSQKNAFKNDVRTKKKVKVVKSENMTGYIKWLLITVGWLYLSYLVHQVMNTEVQEIKLWDPYTLLDIEEGSTLKQIKNKYRKLSLKFHPDKVRGVTEEEAVALNSKYVEITKAYKALTDDDIRRNFEEYGHPDGRQPMSVGIALPAWLVEAHNNIYVLSIYGLILGLFLPYYVGNWWYKSNKYTRDRILNGTMAIYFRELKDNIPMKDLIDLMSASKEFIDEIEYKGDDTEETQLLWKFIKEEAEKNGIIVEESRKYTSKENIKAAGLIQAHLNRVKVSNPEFQKDQQMIVKRAYSLVYGMTQIALAQNWIHATLLCMELSQMIIQAVPYKASPLLQLPNLSNEMIRSLKGKQRNLKNVLEFIKLDDTLRRSLLSSLSDSEYKETISAGLKFPVLKLQAGYIKVLGDDVITPSAILTCVIKLKLSTVEEEISELNAHDENNTVDSDDSLVDDEDSHVRSFLSKASQSHLVPPVHAPYFPADKRSDWWIVIGDLNTGRMLINPTKVTDLVDKTTLKFNFQGPPEPGNYSFNLMVKSDSYLGCDLRKEMAFVVEPASILPEESEVDDDISEPEDNSLAAQMQASKSEGGATAGALNDDLTSSDEE